LCRESLRESESDLWFKERRVVAAIGAVMGGSASKLVTEAEAARREFEGQVAVCRFLRSSVTDDLRQRIDAVSVHPTGFDNGVHPAVVPWAAAAEALSRDAEAALPPQ
jgi:hypothetical protein